MKKLKRKESEGDNVLQRDDSLVFRVFSYFTDSCPPLFIQSGL